jgi:hypothetical protein
MAIVKQWILIVFDAIDIANVLRVMDDRVLLLTDGYSNWLKYLCRFLGNSFSIGRFKTITIETCDCRFVSNMI